MVSMSAMAPLAVALFGLGAVLQGCGGSGGGGGGDDSNSIAKVAEKTPELSTLVTALQNAGLVDTFEGKGPFTVFAPSNDAFLEISKVHLAYLFHNKTALTEVLEYHAASGSVMSGDLKDGEVIKTLEGADVTAHLTNGTVKINDATVTKADVKASNGVIHIINSVLTPPGFTAPTIPEVAISAKLTTLVKAVTAANLGATLSGPGPFTVFAPTDAAFNALPAGVLDSLLKPANLKDLTTVLEYHVVSGEHLSADLKNGDHIKTLQGQVVNISISGSDVSINKAKVTQADVCAENGVVHVIDAVLLPPGFVPPTPGPSPGTCPGSVMKGVDCDTGKDITTKLDVKSDAECCEFCQSVKGCKAWSWNANVAADPHHTCFVHGDCKTQSKKDGVDSGMVGTNAEVIV